MPMSSLAFDVYRIIRAKHDIASIRTSNFTEFLKTGFGITEWMEDPELAQNLAFESYLVDILRDYISGEELDLGDLEAVILRAGKFSMAEKRLFERNKIEEVLWGVMAILGSLSGKINITVNSND